jgi:transposase
MNGLLQESQRGAIVTGIRAGRTKREIADFNNISYNTVKNFAREYYNFIEEGGQDEEFDVKRKKHLRRSDSHSVEIVENVQEAINYDPGRSMRQLAADFEVSEWLIRKIVKEDIRYRSYSLRRGQFMTAATKKTLYEKAAALLSRLKHPPAPDILIFSDEKNFSQDQKVNSRNNRWLCDDPSEVPIVMKTKFPATVMVLGVVSNKGDVMTPHVFEAGLRVNTEVYINVLSNVVKPWMDEVAAGRPYIWQQDGAPAHTSKKTQDWCRDNLPFFWEKEVWPPSSPDCNPMDYFVWGVSERDVNRSPHSSKQSLINSIMEVFASLSREDVKKACSRFRPRLEEVVAVKGDFIR